MNEPMEPTEPTTLSDAPYTLVEVWVDATVHHTEVKLELEFWPSENEMRLFLHGLDPAGSKNGVNGYFVSPHTLQALRDAVTKLLRDPTAAYLLSTLDQPNTDPDAEVDEVLKVVNAVVECEAAPAG